jgi:hypothetical protein
MNTNFVMGNKRDAKLKLQHDNYMSILKRRHMIMHSLKLQAPAPAPAPAPVPAPVPAPAPVNHDENVHMNKPTPTKNKFNILLSKMNQQK